MNRRRENIQAKKRLSWRDPDLPIFTRVLDEGPMGQIIKRAVVLTPEEAQVMAQESMRDSFTPAWNQDPSYDWAAKAKRKRA